MINQDVLERFRVKPGSRLRLADHDPGWAQTAELRRLGKEVVKARAREILAENLEALAQAQELLWASDTRAVLVVLQAMDAAGKDSTIKHVMSGVNPQGCSVVGFKQPSAEELDHNFLWRYARAVPERGKIGIFNRSYYEEVLVVKVHPEILERQRLPPGKRGKSFWEARYEDINAFERHLARNGTTILKFFLHISREEQRERFLARIDDPHKNWKFSAADVTERAHWDAYMQAFEEAIAATSSEWAPWYVVPADNKWVARAVVADILTTTIRSLDLRYPELDEEQRAALLKARAELEAEAATARSKARDAL
jgi:PPK2 family polyphosphate:nucleotide phosphotransferase